MACTNRYLDKCIAVEQRKIVENELYGANKLYDYLCNNIEFQKGRGNKVIYHELQYVESYSQDNLIQLTFLLSF